MYLGGVTWQSSGWDFVVSLPEAWVQSLFGELRSYKPHGVAKTIILNVYWMLTVGQARARSRVGYKHNIPAM